MKILVTGAKGFIGKNLISELHNQGYQDIYDFFHDFGKRNGIDYVDLNQISMRELGLTKESFQDEMHLNGKGAERISRYLADYLSAREENE